MNKKPWRKHSRYKNELTFSSFEADTFAFDDARTHGSLALKIGRKVVVSESANAEQLAYAADAGRRLQEAIAARRKPAPTAPALESIVLRQLLPLLPPPRTLTAAEYKASARTLDDHAAYLRGVEQRATVARNTKTALSAA